MGVDVSHHLKKDMKKKSYAERSDLEKIKSNWGKTIGLFSRKEYSLSIVRAAVTAELSLNFTIRKELHIKRNLPLDFVDNLLKWANGIQGKIDKLLLPILKGSKFHDDARAISVEIKKINEQRNYIAHRGEFRTKETAERYISIARETLECLITEYEPTFELEFNPNKSGSRVVVANGILHQIPIHPDTDED